MAGTPSLGDDSLGKRGFDRGDVTVEAHKVLNAKTGTEAQILKSPLRSVSERQYNRALTFQNEDADLSLVLSKRGRPHSWLQLRLLSRPSQLARNRPANRGEVVER